MENGQKWSKQKAKNNGRIESMDRNPKSEIMEKVGKKI